MSEIVCLMFFKEVYISEPLCFCWCAKSHYRLSQEPWFDRHTRDTTVGLLFEPYKGSNTKRYCSYMPLLCNTMTLKQNTHIHWTKSAPRTSMSAWLLLPFITNHTYLILFFAQPANVCLIMLDKKIANMMMTSKTNTLYCTKMFRAITFDIMSETAMIFFQ